LRRQLAPIRTSPCVLHRPDSAFDGGKTYESWVDLGWKAMIQPVVGCPSILTRRTPPMPRRKEKLIKIDSHFG
jgi:hypothetical protein